MGCVVGVGTQFYTFGERLLSYPREVRLSSVAPAGVVHSQFYFLGDSHRWIGKISFAN